MVSRRDFLKLAGLGTGAALLNACAPKAAPTDPASATPPPTAIPTATVKPTATPDPRKLCFVLWDHQLAMYGYRPRNPDHPLPETVPLKSGVNNRLSRAWIAYWQGLLQLLNPGMTQDQFQHSWNGLVADARAFTNNSGPDTDTFGLHSLTCGGATHEMVTGEREGDWMRIYTLNINDGPPPVPDDPHQIDMTRHFFATTGTNIKLPDGSYVVYGFPQFENCIVPLVSPDHTDLISITRIKAVTRFRSPYNLAPAGCSPPFGCTPTPTMSPTPTSTP